MTPQRELATTLRDVVFRLETLDEDLASALQQGLSPAEFEAFVQSLRAAGERAPALRPVPRVRAKGSAA
jgi:hypothetical protein